MITDALIDLVTSVFNVVAGMLPEHDLGLSGGGGMAQWIADVDSVLPIAGPISVAVVMLGFGAIFVAVRLLLMGWKMLPFT